MVFKRLRPGARPTPAGGRAGLGRRAVALGYDAGRDEAPRVMASGSGGLAERIIALARDNGVPIREDPILVEALATVDLEATIPPELYAVVAEVLAYVYRVSPPR